MGIGGGGKGRNSFTGLASETLPPSGAGTEGGAGGAGIGGGKSASGNGPQDTTGSGQIPRTGSGSGADSSGGTQTVAGLGTSSIPGSGAGSGKSAVPIINSAIPSHAQVPDLPAGKTQELPLRGIQLALVLPMTSYFSNYEAFIAERSVGRDTTQLIKLVYIFLPYQRRLTEFGVNTSKTFNLRVTRDPSCDESLLSMTWPEGETQNDVQTAASNKNKLPCYRTTADDYRKAWEKAR